MHPLIEPPGQTKDGDSSLIQRLATYGQDPRADAVDALLCLPPQSPSGNAFAAKAEAKHKQLLLSNAFYRAHHNEELDVERDTSPASMATTSNRGNLMIVGSDHTTPATPNEQSAMTFPPQNATPTTSKRRLTPAEQICKALDSTKPARPNTLCQNTDQVSSPDVHIPSLTALLPELHRGKLKNHLTTEAPVENQPDCATTPHCVAINSKAAATSPTQHFDRPPRSSSVQSSKLMAFRHHMTGTPSTMSDDHAIPLSPSRSSCNPGNQSKTDHNLPFATSPVLHESQGSLHEKKLPAVPGNGMMSIPDDGQSAIDYPHPSATKALKLIPSPHVTQVAEPTRRALIEQRKEQSDIDKSRSKAERYFQTSENDNTNARSSSPCGFKATEPKTPKKSSFLQRIKISWNAMPSFALGRKGEVVSTHAPDAYGPAVGDRALIHAQPKAHAILFGRSQSQMASRSPSKKSLVRWRPDINSHGTESPPKPSSPSRKPPPIDSPLEFPEETRFEYKDAPTPPAKDTPPNNKVSKQAEDVGLGLRNFERTSSTYSSHQSPRFGRHNGLEVAPLITRPIENQYHRSVIPELVTLEDFKHFKSRLDGLDIHGLQLSGRDDSIAMHSYYSPSLYTPRFGRRTTDDGSYTPRTRCSSMISETRSIWHISTAVPSKIDPLQRSKPSSMRPPEYDTIRQEQVSNKARAISSATVTIAYPGLSSDPSMTRLGDPDFVQSQIEKAQEKSVGLSETPEWRSSSIPKNDFFTCPKDSRFIAPESDVFSESPKVVFSPTQVGRGALPHPGSQGDTIERAADLSSSIPGTLHKELLLPSLRHLPILPVTTFVEPLKPKRLPRTSASFGHTNALVQTASGSEGVAQQQNVKDTRECIPQDEPQEDGRLMQPLSQSDQNVHVDDIENDSTFDDLLISVSHGAERAREMTEQAIAEHKNSNEAQPQGRGGEVRQHLNEHAVGDTIITAADQGARMPAHKERPKHGAREEPSFITHHLSREPSSPALESSPDITKGQSRSLRKTKQTRIVTTSHSGSPRERRAHRAELISRPTLEESMAKNRAYEETIAKLVRRLAEVEKKSDV